MKIRNYILFGLGLIVVGWVAWTVAPKEKVVYRDTPQDRSWCQLPLAVGTKGSPIKGDLSGMSGEIAGKISDGADCAYYVKFTNKNVWNGDGVHYQPVNAENFVETLK